MQLKFIRQKHHTIWAHVMVKGDKGLQKGGLNFTNEEWDAVKPACLSIDNAGMGVTVEVREH